MATNKFGLKRILSCAISCVLLFLVSFSTVQAKENSTLRNFKYGDKLPAFKASPLKGGAPETITPGGGKPTLLVFFSIRPDFRKKRSLALLSSLADLADKFKNKIKIVGVYCDDKDSDTVIKYVNSFAARVPVYSDSNKDIYNRYGVFMMPLTIMTTAKGKLHEVIPYTYNIREMINGNFKLLLGEWSKEQLQNSLKPKQVVAKTDDEKEYIRRVNYGRIMLSKKMYSQAVREFSNAVKIRPKAIEAHLELGFTNITMKNWQAAKKSFNTAQKIDKDSDDAIAGLGLAYYGEGSIDQALPILESAFIASQPKLEVIIALAEIYETKGDNVKANRLNKLAISRLMTLYEQRWK